MIRPCYVEINTINLKNNINNIQRHVGNKEIIGVIKADAYGHGAIEVANVLDKEGVNFFAVATVEEALELRNNYMDKKILILGPVNETQFDLCIKNNIIISVSSYNEAVLISSYAQKLNKTVNIHIALDTGMGRIGFQCSDTSAVIEEIKNINTLNYINIHGVFTHFPRADEKDLSYTKQQYDLFKNIVLSLKDKGINPEYIHCQNSAAIVVVEDDICTAVRPGIILYGYYPSEFIPKILNLKPCLQWKCYISHIKDVPANTPIGYNATYITTNTTTVATIPVGYADGLSRLMSNGGKVIVEGQESQIIGRVCMDQAMLDVSHIADCKIGTEVILIGETFNADYMAERISTISYEVLCSISKRVPRVYI